MAIAMGTISWVEKAEGETVVLGCTWKVDPTATEQLDVEWFLQTPTTNIYLATFVGDEEHVYPDFASRVRFVRNVTQRDASLQIAALQGNDGGVYTCRVKFGAFIQQVPIRLVVLAGAVKASQPSCVVNGSVLQGKELSLRCLSTEGTSPISYEWKKAGGEEPLPSVLASRNARRRDGRRDGRRAGRVSRRHRNRLLRLVPAAQAGVQPRLSQRQLQDGRLPPRVDEPPATHVRGPRPAQHGRHAPENGTTFRAVVDLFSLLTV
ncbi:coxsackievirus and adenovirus receptor-like [Lethenteron reissneri]|uniref:coxsackievirus and adenovirus receptor-like n=1 Tax=Lethenteron reissneri TaxID=7753 RepID=UPI002AB7B137|nr:coxsackievirus and adenovirus receptor-like [Lethenteron reissneri]